MTDIKRRVGDAALLRRLGYSDKVQPEAEHSAADDSQKGLNRRVAQADTELQKS